MQFQLTAKNDKKTVIEVYFTAFAAETARKIETPQSSITRVCTHQRRATPVTRWKDMLLHSPTAIDTKGKT